MVLEQVGRYIYYTVKNDEINFHVPYVINICASLKVLENFTGGLEMCSRE